MLQCVAIRRRAHEAMPVDVCCLVGVAPRDGAQRTVDERLVPARALTSLKTFRDLIVNLSEVARTDSLSIALGKMLDQTGYLQDLRDDKSEESQGRIENLMELVSAAREYEARDPEASLGGFTDQLSLLSEAV